VSKVRGVRFHPNEDEKVEEFLRSNPLLDFSTLARIAIINFIKNPSLKLIPVNRIKKPRLPGKREAHVESTQ